MKETKNLVAIESLLMGLYLHIEILILGHKLNKDAKQLLDNFCDSFNKNEENGLGAFWHSRNQMYKLIYFDSPNLIKEIEKNPTFSASDLDKELINFIQSYREFKETDDSIFDGDVKNYPHGVIEREIKKLLPDAANKLRTILNEIEHARKKLREIEDDIYWKKVSLGLIEKE